MVNKFNIQSKALSLIVLFIFIGIVVLPVHAQSQTTSALYNSTGEMNSLVYKQYKEKTRQLVSAIDIKKLLLTVVTDPKDLNGFTKFVKEELAYDKRKLTIEVGEGKIVNKEGAQKYIAERLERYRSYYSNYITTGKQSQELAARMEKGLMPFTPGRGPSRSPGAACDNMDFETQTLTGWTGSWGSSQDPTATAAFSTGPVNGLGTEHTIMTAGTDPIIPSIPCVMPSIPAGTASLRLGDCAGGGLYSARISQTFLVNPSSPYFIYNYAAIIQDGGSGHTAPIQPYFKIRMYAGVDNTAPAIDCASLDINGTSASSLGLTLSAGSYYYKNWTQVLIPLNSYAGTNVTIEFTVSDCMGGIDASGNPAPGSHDAWAYIECSCNPPQIVTSSPTICGGTSINVSAPAGLASYSWTGPGIVGSSTGQTITANTAGSYAVTMTTVTTPPNAPCTFTLDTIIPGNPSVPVAAFSNTTVCSGGSTVFTDASTPAGSISTWAWDFNNDGTTDSNVQNPSYVFPGAGTYPVTLNITWGGCNATITQNVTVNPGTAPSITAAGPFCSSAAPVTLSATPTGGVWGGPGITNTATGAFDPASAAIGNNTITYTVGGACGGTANSTIVINPPPVSNAGPDVTICSGTAATIGSATTAGDTYSWLPAAGLSSTTISNPGITTTNAGTTPIVTTYTVTTTALTCTSTDQVIVTVNPPVTANAGPPQTICTGTSAILAGAIGGGGATGTWSGGAGTFAPGTTTLNASYTPSAAEEAAGSVTLTLTSSPTAGPCPPATSTVTITINPLAVINAGPDQTICIGGTAQLAGVISGGATSGTWTGGAGTYSTSNTDPLAVYTPSAGETAAGTVTLTFTSDDPAGPCGPVNDAVVITIAALPSANAGPDQTICDGSSAILAGAIGGAATSDTWTGGAGTFSPNATTLNASYTPTAAEAAAGSVTLTLTTNDPVGPCTFATDQMVITINPVATVNAGPDQTICSGSTATLAGVIGGSATTGTWSGGTGTFAPSATTANAVYTPTVAEAAAGTVTLTYTTDDPAGPCAGVNDQMVITINQVPTANAGSSQHVCAGATITLGGAIGGSATSGTWSGGTGTYFPNSSTLNAVYTPSAAEYAADSVVLTLTTNDPAGPCTFASSNVILYFYSNPVAAFTVVDPNGCPVHCASFTDLSTVAGGDNIVTWSWDLGDGATSTIQNPGHCYQNTGLYDVTLTVTSNHGCTNTLTIPHAVEVYAKPHAAFTPTPNVGSVLNPVITLNNESSSDVNYWFWSFGDGDTLSPNTSSPVHSYPNANPGTYTTTLIVHNADGCYDTTSQDIIIGPEFTFFIPNAFTPNADGVNDFFFGSGIGITQYDIWIFDRWGNMIFHGNHLDDYWDGRANGGSEEAQQDVYVWKVKLTDVFDKKHDYIGTVTIVK